MDNRYEPKPGDKILIQWYGPNDLHFTGKYRRKLKKYHEVEINHDQWQKLHGDNNIARVPLDRIKEEKNNVSS